MGPRRSSHTGRPDDLADERVRAVGQALLAAVVTIDELGVIEPELGSSVA